MQTKRKADGEFFTEILLPKVISCVNFLSSERIAVFIRYCVSKIMDAIVSLVVSFHVKTVWYGTCKI